MIDLGATIDLLFKEGFYESAYDPDPADPRVTTGKTVDRGVVKTFTYINYEGHIFPQAGPSTALFQNFYPGKPYAETLTLLSYPNTPFSIGYSAEGSYPLVTTLTQTLTSAQSPPDVEDIITQLHSILVTLQDPSTFFCLTFRTGALSPEEAKEFVKIVMNLKPRNP